MTALFLEHITHSFDSLPVIEDISLEIYPGEIVSVLGPSGCGKSTLLRIASGLIEAETGRVDRQYRPVLTFQDPSLLPWRTVQENILLPLTLAGLENQADIKQRTADLIGQVGLTGFEDYYPQALSGGMQQRAALARALITKPQLLMMDEPFGALDELTREKMNGLLLSTRRAQDETSPAAVLFVTHSLSEAVYLSDRVVVLSPRPARVEAIVDIDLPRPRPAEIRYSTEFNQLTRKLRQLLRL